jgi:hypothetical protein
VAVRTKGDSVLFGIRSAGNDAVQITPSFVPPAALTSVFTKYVLLSFLVGQPMRLPAIFARAIAEVAVMTAKFVERYRTIRLTPKYGNGVVTTFSFTKRAMMFCFQAVPPCQA